MTDATLGPITTAILEALDSGKKLPYCKRCCIVPMSNVIFRQLRDGKIRTPGMKMMEYKESFEDETFLVKFWGDMLPEVPEGYRYPRAETNAEGQLVCEGVVLPFELLTPDC